MTELCVHLKQKSQRLFSVRKLYGKYFETHVKDGDKFKKGDLLISFDMEGIRREGYKLSTPMIVCNTTDYESVKAIAKGNIKHVDIDVELK